MPIEHHIYIITCLIVFCRPMSKQTNTSDSINPAKHTWKKGRFQVAQSISALKEPPLNSLKSVKSVFVTVTHPDEQCEVLKGQTQVLSNTPDSPEPPSSLAVHSDADRDLPILSDSLPPEEVPLAKGKRRWHTKNVVCYPCNSYIYDIFDFNLQDRLSEWIEFHATFLDKALQHNGLGDLLGHTDCSHCAKALGKFRCIDCPSRRMLKCAECIVTLHQSIPLHHVEVSRCLYGVTWLELIS